jgi:hypothetical protein
MSKLKVLYNIIFYGTLLSNKEFNNLIKYIFNLLEIDVNITL